VHLYIPLVSNFTHDCYRTTSKIDDLDIATGNNHEQGTVAGKRKIDLVSRKSPAPITAVEMESVAELSSKPAQNRLVRTYK